MSGLIRRVTLVALLSCCCWRWSAGSILGHSGLVLHVDKHGHLSGHSTHYDYRFYPEEFVFDHDPHFHYIDDAEMHEAFQLIEDNDHHAFYHHHQPEDDHYHHLIHHDYRR